MDTHFWAEYCSSILVYIRINPIQNINVDRINVFGTRQLKHGFWPTDLLMTLNIQFHFNTRF
jgi:hypothetical protein